MKNSAMWRGITLFTLLLLEILASDRSPIRHRYSDSEYIVNNDIRGSDLNEFNKLATDMNEEDVKPIFSFFDDDDKGETLKFQTNALIDTKYRTWKRNADLINSLLALPKDMNDAGRR